VGFDTPQAAAAGGAWWGVLVARIGEMHRQCALSALQRNALLDCMPGGCWLPMEKAMVGGSGAAHCCKASGSSARAKHWDQGNFRNCRL